MSIQTIIRTLEFKLYLNDEQEVTLTRWLGKCCWIFNNTLAQRIKAYQRREESIGFNQQCAWLTGLRERIESVRLVPLAFERDALRRVDRGMKAFFRRCKAGAKKKGFPRFKPGRRYNSLEQLGEREYVKAGKIQIPKLGAVRARGRFEDVTGKQKALRVLRRPSGWYAQIVVETPTPELLPATGQDCGIDLGLERFATLDSGESFPNPRLLRKATSKLSREQRRLARCTKGSQRRVKARERVAKLHERVARQRRGHAHRAARSIVNRFDRIAVEKLNVKGLAAGMLAKSVNDAGWGIFLKVLSEKAESAARLIVEVNPAGSSQTCPRCGAVARKELSERIHRCQGCDFECHRDVAAAMVIRQRAFRPACVEGPATTSEGTRWQADPLKRKVAVVATQ